MAQHWQASFIAAAGHPAEPGTPAPYLLSLREALERSGEASPELQADLREVLAPVVGLT